MMDGGRLKLLEELEGLDWSQVIICLLDFSDDVGADSFSCTSCDSLFIAMHEFVIV